jgi:hypothetical protein
MQAEDLIRLLIQSTEGSEQSRDLVPFPGNSDTNPKRDSAVKDNGGGRIRRTVCSRAGAPEQEHTKCSGLRQKSPNADLA